MIIQNFKFVNKTPVICSFDLLFTGLGFGIRELRLMESGGKQWIASPARQYQDETGKKKYFSYVFFEAPERKAAFEKKLLELLKPHLIDKPVAPKTWEESSDLPF